MSITDNARRDIRDAVKRLLQSKKDKINLEHKPEMDMLEEAATIKMNAEFHYDTWKAEYDRLSKVISDAHSAIKNHTNSVAMNQFPGFQWSPYREDDCAYVAHWFDKKVDEEYKKSLAQTTFYPQLQQCDDIWDVIDVMITLATSQSGIVNVHNRLAQLLGVPIGEALKIASEEGLHNL